MRTMTKEQKAKMGAARQQTVEANRARRAKTIQVDDFFVFRADEYNWVLTKTPDDANNFAYYPTITSAMKALVHEAIGEGNKRTLTEILDGVKRIEEAILKQPVLTQFS